MADLSFLSIGAACVSHLILRKIEPTVLGFIRFSVTSTLLLFAYLLSTSALPSLSSGKESFWFLLSTVGTTIKLVAIYFLTLTGSILVYRLFLHPLRDIPGPAIAKATQWWSVFSMARGYHYLDEEKLYNKYKSPFIRKGPNDVMIVHPQAVIDILGGNSNLPKSRQYVGSRGGFEASLINIKDPDLHALRRRDWAKGFTMDALKDYNTIFETRIAELIPLLKEKAKEGPIDLTRYIKAFACDVMGDLSGFKFQQMQDGRDVEGFWKKLENVVVITAVLKKIPEWSMFLANTIGEKRQKDMAAFVAAKLRQRFSGKGQTKDIFHFILAGEDDLDFNELLPKFTRDAILLMIAGADTTQGSLGCLFYFLLRYPERYIELQKAIDHLYAENGVSGGEPLPARVLSSCHILDAYINETMRLSPPLKSGQPREIPKGGRIICGRYFPEGTTVSTPAWTMHRNPKFFSRPLEFRPERFLYPEKEDLFTPQVFFPFSYGPMNCLGKHVAMEEQRIVISTLIRAFDMEVVPGGGFETFEATQNDYIVTVLGPLKVKLIERNFG